MKFRTNVVGESSCNQLLCLYLSLTMQRREMHCTVSSSYGALESLFNFATFFMMLLGGSCSIHHSWLNINILTSTFHYLCCGHVYPCNCKGISVWTSLVKPVCYEIDNRGPVSIGPPKICIV